MLNNSFPAPAKINPYLRVLKKRADGYHTLDTAFQFLEFADQLTFDITTDTNIRRIDRHPFNLPSEDLCIRAATLLQRHTNTKRGVTVTLHKNIPPGSGLGGGSSNAATVLLALNQLWELNLPRAQLADMGMQLGADVPVFLYGHAARATGVGEVLEPYSPPEKPIVLFLPPVTVSTADIFSRWRNAPSPADSDNDLESITATVHPEVAAALKKIHQHTNAQMTGSGAAIFAECDSQQAAEKLTTTITSIPTIITHSRNRHPLCDGDGD